jgi:two-component system, chemotaxis family, chemotaxis protein CheY
MNKNMKGVRIKIKVLIVDDHPLTLSMLSQIMKQLGFNEVREANDGNLALEILDKEDIKLVFTDLNMPNMSGIEVIQRIRGKAETRELPVIVVSGEGDQDIVVSAMQAGADSFIVKPFAAQTIKEKILQVLSKRAQ